MAEEFISTAMSVDALRFGSFILKSGRQSPYFFNLGCFKTGSALSVLAKAYAQALLASDQEFDVLFGPAYKGIPLAALTVAKMAELDPSKGTIEYAFNRKETKDHGEGGNTVGAQLKNRRIVVIDDVITAGTAINEAFEIINSAGGMVVGVIVALDRQERVGDGSRSAIQQVIHQHNIPVMSLATLADVVAYTEKHSSISAEMIAEIRRYRDKYGAAEFQIS